MRYPTCAETNVTGVLCLHFERSNPCRDVQDRADWRQSRLDAYAAAVTIRDQARARYDAAASAYRSAEAHLRDAQAQVSRRSRTPGGKAANSGGGPDDRGGGRSAV